MKNGLPPFSHDTLSPPLLRIMRKFPLVFANIPVFCIQLPSVVELNLYIEVGFGQSCIIPAPSVQLYLFITAVLYAVAPLFLAPPYLVIIITLIMNFGTIIPDDLVEEPPLSEWWSEGKVIIMLASSQSYKNWVQTHCVYFKKKPSISTRSHLKWCGDYHLTIEPDIASFLQEIIINSNLLTIK